MSDNKKPAVNQRINEAVAAGRLDPDRVPDLMDDIRKLSTDEARSFFSSVYPPETIDQIAAMLDNGTQLPEDDMQLLSYMPSSRFAALPDTVQESVMEFVNTSDEVQSTLKQLQHTLDNVIDTVCQEAGITREEYGTLMQALLNDIDAGQYPISDNDTDIKHLAELLRKIKLCNNKYMPLLQGTATNKLRLSSTKNIVPDNNGNGTLESAGFKAFFKDYVQLKGGLSTGAKKLLDAGAVLLAENNRFRAKKGTNIDTAVSISLEDYGRMRGYDISPRATSTPEEEKAERKRISNLLHEIRKRANAELAILYSLSLSWTEPGKKNADYKDIRVLQSKGISGGYITMRFSEDMADYLVHAYLMQYPKALQALDERNPRSYNIGYKLALHHGMDNNREKGTANIISVKALIEAGGDIPTFEKVQASKDRGHWERRIKDPLEAALDSNLAGAVIASWEYCNGKNIPLDEEQVSIADYQTFIGLYIHFEMENEPDQSARLQRKEIRKAKEKKPRSKKVSGNP